MTGRLHPVGRQPGGSFLAGAQTGQPRAPDISSRHAVMQSGRIVSQVGDRVTINVVFANGQWLQAIAETLCALRDTRHDIE
jgi:hypothetical protein